MTTPGPGGGRAIVLLSGGLDSAVVALLAADEKAYLHFLSFDYQQRNRRELECARRVARAIRPQAPHDIVHLDMAPLIRSQSSALLAAVESAPPARRSFYVPGRNLIFLAHAGAVAEGEGIDTIYVGSNLQDALGADGQGYPDSGPVFLKRAEATLRTGLEKGTRLALRAPLLKRNKFEAIRLGHQRGFDFALTWSCYEEGPEACGTCPACRARLTNFHWAGLLDPIPYQADQMALLARALSP